MDPLCLFLKPPWTFLLTSFLINHSAHEITQEPHSTGSELSSGDKFTTAHCVLWLEQQFPLLRTSTDSPIFAIKEWGGLKKQNKTKIITLFPYPSNHFHFLSNIESLKSPELSGSPPFFFSYIVSRAENLHVVTGSEHIRHVFLKFCHTQIISTWLLKTLFLWTLHRRLIFSHLCVYLHMFTYT